MSAARAGGARNVGVDLAKLFACIGVLVVHLVGRDSSPVNGVMFFLAGFAVPVFFIANGYFVLNRQPLTYDYVFKKLQSVVSVVILWTALWWAAMCFKDRAFVNPLLILFQSALGLGGLSWFWFFGALALVQLLSPVLANINSRSSYNQMALLVVACLLCVFVHVLDLRALNSTSLGVLAVPEALRLWTWVAYFLWGGVLGNPCFREWGVAHLSRSRCLIAVAISAAIAAVTQYGIGYRFFGIMWPEHFYDSPATMVLALSVFVACDLYPPENLGRSMREGGLVGSASGCIMGIYIIHPFLWQLVKRFYNFSNPVLNFGVVALIGFVSFAATFCLKRIPVANRLVKL